VEPLPNSVVIEIVNVMLAELKVALGIPKIVVARLYGANPEPKFKKKIILVGASHMRRLQEKLTGSGIESSLVEAQPIHWRATTQLVNDLTANIKMAVGMQSGDEVAIVIGALDNSYFQTRYEDGEATPIRRSVEGIYHVDGDIVCSPLDSAKKAFNQMVPLLKSFQEYDKMFLAPIPRYLWRACCDNPAHAPNIKEDGHVEHMMAELDAVNKAWKTISYMEKIRNIKVANAGNTICDISWWGSDPVHPLPQGYEKLASFIVTGLESLENRRLALNLDKSGTGQTKRGHADDGLHGSLNPAKRPAWTRNDDNFVSRDFRWTGRGRGSYTPFRGRGSGGFGWPRRGQHW
jgi:hypothetical protein